MQDCLPWAMDVSPEAHQGPGGSTWQPQEVAEGRRMKWLVTRVWWVEQDSKHGWRHLGSSRGGAPSHRWPEGKVRGPAGREGHQPLPGLQGGARVVP